MWWMVMGRENHSRRYLEKDCVGSWNLVNKRESEGEWVWNGWQGPDYRGSFGSWGDFGLLGTKAVLRA